MYLCIGRESVVHTGRHWAQSCSCIQATYRQLRVQQGSLVRLSARSDTTPSMRAALDKAEQVLDSPSGHKRGQGSGALFTRVAFLVPAAVAPVAAAPAASAAARVPASSSPPSVAPLPPDRPPSLHALDSTQAANSRCLY